MTNSPQSCSADITSDPTAFINARLADLAEANALYGKDQRLSAQDKIARNNREISWLKDLRTIIAFRDAAQPAPQRQRYVAELSLNKRYVWCIVEAIPRVENVIEQFGCGPDAQKAAQAKLDALAAQPPAAPVTDGSIQEGDVLSYTMKDGVGKVTAHVRPHSGCSAGNATGAGSTVPELLVRAEKYLAINAADGRGSGLLVMELADALRALTSTEPQPTRETVRQSEDALKGWLAYAEENLSEFGVDGESCTGDKLCPSCENSGCIQFKIEETRIALASLALT